MSFPEEPGSGDTLQRVARLTKPSVAMHGIPTSVLAAYRAEGARVEPFGAGLINATWLVLGDPPVVLQRLNPIFDPLIHRNIDAVVRRLDSVGMETPHLVQTTTGSLYMQVDGSVYRAQTFVPGETFDRVTDASQAHGAGELVGRFHGALSSLDHTFVGMREGVHDTSRHLHALRQALAETRDHRLHATVDRHAATLFALLGELPPLPPGPTVVGHGDPKFNNVRFREGKAVCLVDLDTVGPIHLGYELGDMWRSWCNRSGEDDTEARLDADVLRASFEGYAAGWGNRLDEEARVSLLFGLEWVSLELSSRFLADALRETYFGWDPVRFESRGDHNLVRATGQLALAHAAKRSRPERARILGVD